MPPPGLSPQAFRRWHALLGRIADRAQVVALRTQAGRARPLWRATYEFLARFVGAYLAAAGRDATVYVAAGIAAGDPVYGLSDIDLVVVTPEDDSVRRRRAHLRRALPPVGDLFSDLAVYSPAELDRAVREPTFTQADGAVYLGPSYVRDEAGLRERPGLQGAAADWRLLKGRDRRPPPPAMDDQRLRIAAWLELQFWWRMAMQFVPEPAHRQSPYVALKVITHAARSWLAVEHGELPQGRHKILTTARDRLPEEHGALDCALTLESSLSRQRMAPWEQVLPALARFSDRIARSLEAAATAAGYVEVELTGVPTRPPLPLLDWRGLVLPERPDEMLDPVPGDPGRAGDLAQAVGDGATGYRGLRSGRLLVLATTAEPWIRSFLRGVACSSTDPVSFALYNRAVSAGFPQLRGWSIADVARRSLEEHRGWLAHAGEHGVLSERAWLDGRSAGRPAPLRVAAKLLTSARAVVLSESTQEGAPDLPVSVDAVARALAERHPTTRDCVHEVAGAYGCDQAPEPGALRELRETLRTITSGAEKPDRNPVPT